MVSFFEIISLFAGVSLFLWLAYGPLLLRKNPPQDLRAITEYFIFSFAFYAVSAVADYLLHHLDRITFPWNILWIVTLIVVTASFILGSETLLVAGYYVRRFGQVGVGEGGIPPFKFVMQLTYLTTFSLISALSGFLTALTYVGRTYFLMNVGMAIYGAYGYAKSWRNPTDTSRKRLTYPILATYLWILVSIVMNLLFGWPM